jgi:hypothetical protein
MVNKNSNRQPPFRQSNSHMESIAIAPIIAYADNNIE